MRINSNIVWRKIDDTIFIIDPLNEKIHELNETASIIFEMIIKNKKIDEIEKKILKEYDVDEKECRKDILAIISELKEKGVISE
jgi:GH35 family endo-1,4-beta-xylanase